MCFTNIISLDLATEYKQNQLYIYICNQNINPNNSVYIHMRLFCDHVSCCNINLLWNVVCGMHTLHQSQLEFFPFPARTRSKDESEDISRCNTIHSEVRYFPLLLCTLTTCDCFVLLRTIRRTFACFIHACSRDIVFMFYFNRT